MTSYLREDVVACVQALREKNGDSFKIGYTSGTFDILHRGHVTYLKKARQMCDHLIVAVNSNLSVKGYKSSLRPINHQNDRALVLSSLECVDSVFIFDDLNNNNNIELIKPDLYIKAGDYTVEQLSSAPQVFAYGGDVKIIKFEDNISTTTIIDKCATISNIVMPPSSKKEKRPAVFVDRDGTIIKLVNYLSEVDRVELVDGATEGLKKFAEAGYRIVMTTNQPGIGLGFFSLDDFFKVTLRVFKLVSEQGVLFDKVYFSPAGKGEKCDFRKPSTGMGLRAKNELNVDIENSIVIGDSTADLEFGKRLGCPTALVKTGKYGQDGLYDATPDYTGNSILEVADKFLSVIN